MAPTKPDRLLLLSFASAALASTALLAIAAPDAFRDFFDWPEGGVWSNLVASAIWGVPAFWAIARRLHRQHQEHLSLLRAQHEKHLAILAASHAALLERIGTRSAAS